MVEGFLSVPPWKMPIRKIHRWIVNLADWSKLSRLGTLIIVQIHSMDSNLGKIIRISTRYSVKFRENILNIVPLFQDYFSYQK